MHLLLVKTCGSEEQKQPRNVVILGLDPGIQGIFNLQVKDSKILLHTRHSNSGKKEQSL